jgi:hypothetical protein
MQSVMCGRLCRHVSPVTMPAWGLKQAAKTGHMHREIILEFQYRLPGVVFAEKIRKFIMRKCWTAPVWYSM